MEINLEMIETEVRKAKSVVMLVQGDLMNEEGGYAEEVLFNALESALESLMKVEYELLT